MADEPTGAPDITALFGPMLLGVILSTLLYGVILVQAFLYYHRYRSDRTWFRYLVLYLVVAETANWVCDVGLVYEPLILRYGTPRALTIAPLLLRPDALLTVIISTPTQLFVAWRVRVVTRSTFLASLIALIAIVALGGGIATTTAVSIHPDFARFSHFKPEVVTWLVASALCDVLLTSSLVVSLWKRKTNVVSTDSYINKIIRLTVQTGMVTAAAACGDMLLYVLIPNATYNFILDFPLSKLYTISLISTLNARPWREDVSKHSAPNVLFENTGPVSLSGQSVRPASMELGFALSQRKTMSNLTGHGTDSYVSHPYASAHLQDYSSAKSQYTLDVSPPDSETMPVPTAV